jgi:membrane-associated protease RseP (regulator of RpoE activity)
MPEPMFQAMFRAQCAWDAAMGWNALQALKKHGGDRAIMVVLIGAGHVAYGLGAERQVKPWFDGKTASVIPVPITEEAGEAPVEKVQASYADFVWGLPPSTDPLYPSVGISTPEQKSGERYRVIMVAKESPAEAAGFKVGDELVSIDGIPYTDKELVNRLMSEKRWGDTVVYEVVREAGKAPDGSPILEERTLTAYLRRQPPKPKTAAEKTPEAPEAPAGMPAMPPKPPAGGGQ